MRALLSLVVVLSFGLAAVADDLDADSKKLLDEHRKNATHLDQQLKSLRTELEAAKKGRLNPRQSETKAGSVPRVTYRTKQDKEQDVSRIETELAAVTERATRVTQGRELCLTNAREFSEAGGFYCLRTGSLFQVRDGSSCLWQFQRDPLIVFLLKGLSGLDADKPETLELKGKVFKCTGRTAIAGESILVFELFDTRKAEAALKK